MSFQDTSMESLNAQRRMLKESIADVERLRKAGEVTGDAYLARPQTPAQRSCGQRSRLQEAGLQHQSGNHPMPELRRYPRTRHGQM